ncbi:MAG: YciI family protein [Alphaproteobacteria bacterium]|jgi:hypothetical protein|nr:YciI family protein [Pseudomonadota bacterium]MCZ6607208.1 YciI family protein [Alphaproteobacteria bacterium]
MIYVITCVDKPGHGAVRKENRTAHLAYLRDAGDTLFAAGPTLTDDASSVTGSVIMVDLPDKQAAETFAADDPYAKAGVFESVTIKAWKKVFPED